MNRSSYRAGQAAFRSFRQGLLLSTSVAGFATVAAAADAPDQTSKESLIPEVTVTAQKRTESILKVPISITKIDQETLDKMGAKTMDDIGRLVPGLSFGVVDDAGDYDLAIRGIDSEVGDSTTGVYIDDVPVQARQDAVGTNPYPQLFDLDSVEVDRGPQGTLFGAGAEGGAVRFITPEASLHDWSGFSRAELAWTDGSDSPTWEIGTAVGGPIIDGKVGFRLSAQFRQEDGYVNRVDPATGLTVAPDSNTDATTVVHLAFKIAPTDELVITPELFFQRVRKDDAGLYYESAGPFNNLSFIPQPTDDHFILPSVGVTYDFGDFSVKSITAYLDRAYNTQYDATDSFVGYYSDSFSVPGHPNNYAVSETSEGQINFTQELRFTSNDTADSRLSWVAGLFYGHMRSDSQGDYTDSNWDTIYENFYHNFYGGHVCIPCIGKEALPGNVVYYDHYVETETDKAIFGNVTYALTPDLKVAAGLRVARDGYTYSDKYGGPWDYPPLTYQFSGGEKETPVTPRFNVTYQLSDDQMVYASISKGYRVGGANEPLPTACDRDLAEIGQQNGNTPYKSDSLWQYELGVKGKFFDDTVEMESSLFWIYWHRIQQSVYLSSCYSYIVENLGNALSRGADTQIDWYVSKNLTLGVTGGITDARYTKSDVVGTPPVLLTKEGDTTEDPEFSATAYVEYRRDLGEFMPNTQGYARVDYQFQGSDLWEGSADTFGYDPYEPWLPSQHYVTMRAGVTRGKWDVSLFANNVLNSRTTLLHYHNYPAYNAGPNGTFVSAANGNVGTYGIEKDVTYRPTTLGIDLEYKF